MKRCFFGSNFSGRPVWIAILASALEGRSPFDQWVPVHLPGGPLDIKVAKDLSQVWLRGAVRFVFQGSLP